MQRERLHSARLHHEATVPPVIAGGTDANTHDRLYSDECLKTVKA